MGSSRSQIADELFFINHEVMTGSHYLTVQNPSTAEKYFILVRWSRENPELFKGGDQYIEVNFGDEEHPYYGYVLVRQDGAGRYSRTLPPNVDPKTVIRAPVKDDQERPVLTGLRTCDRRLEEIKNLYSKVDGIDEPEDVKQQVLRSTRVLQEMIRNAATLYDPHFLDSFINSISGEVLSSPNWIDWLRNEYEHCKITGEVYASFLFIENIVPHVKASTRYEELNRSYNIEQFVYRVVGEKNSHWFLRGLVRDGFLSEVLDAAARLSSSGDLTLTTAMELPPQEFVMEQFNNLLFSAYPYYIASLDLYDFLLHSPDESVVGLRSDPDAVETLKRHQMLCDEKLARIWASLQDAVFDVKRQMTRRRISEIRRVRAEGGEVQAELMAMQLIELELLYPKCFIDELLEK